ncbi:MAG TPA: pitrilysin family protein, partial [Thermoanaerobaculia bacterium]|nr:pitrilysin family protein [Thermoanaerobaculia bacterium]
MKTRTALASIALALALAPPLRADKQTPPAPAVPKGFSVPKPKTFTLENGFAVTLVPYGTVPKVTVRLAVLTGNINETANQVWLADLVGDMLSEGTSLRTASRIAEDAARMGGSLDITVGENRTEIGGDVLSEFGPEMVGLVADVARNPKFPEPELARRKADRARQLSIARSQPQPLAQEKFRAVLYGDHPYGRLFPTEAMLMGYTLADVREFYEKNYGAGRSHLYVVGRYDDAAIESAIRKAFAGWKKGAPPQLTPPSPKSERAVYIVDRPGAVQSTISLGLPVIDPSQTDWDALFLMNVLLGGSFGSRITSNIREQKGYTYS